MPFPSQYAVQTITKLREEFEDCFADFDDAAIAEKIKLFQNPFKCEIEKAPTELQLELNELMTNENLKEYFQECCKNGDLRPFYRYSVFQTYFSDKL